MGLRTRVNGHFRACSYPDKAVDYDSKEGVIHGTPFDIVRKAEESGLVHIGVCFYCKCCCEILYSLTRANRFDLLGSSRYRATVKTESCKGCQTCIERCLFNTIEMVKIPDSKKMQAKVNSEKCMGCGVCVITCKSRALTPEIARPPEYITSQPRYDTSPEFRRASPWGFYELKVIRIRSDYLTTVNVKGRG